MTPELTSKSEDYVDALSIELDKQQVYLYWNSVDERKHPLQDQFMVQIAVTSASCICTH